MGRVSPLKNQRTSAGLGLLHIRRRVSRRSTNAVLLVMTTGWARIDLLVWSEHSEGQKWVYCKDRFKLEGLFLEQTLPKALYLILYL